jgi:hypothetical protein
LVNELLPHSPPHSDDCSRPNPSIDELEEASLKFCEIPWSEIHSSHQLNSHEMTSEEKLPARCVEALYITTLLEDGFGFRGTHRGITLALEVDGTEVEWTLGFALAEECLQSTSRNESSDPHVSPVVMESTPSLDGEEKEWPSSTTSSEKPPQTQTDKKEETIPESENVKQQETKAGEGEGKVSRQLKSLLHLSKISFAKFSQLLLRTLENLSLRLQFTLQLLVLKPLKVVSHQLKIFLLQFQGAISQAVKLVRHRLPPSLVRRFDSSPNSTNPSPSSPPTPSK